MYVCNVFSLLISIARVNRWTKEKTSALAGGKRVCVRVCELAVGRKVLAFTSFRIGFMLVCVCRCRHFLVAFLALAWFIWSCPSVYWRACVSASLSDALFVCVALCFPRSCLACIVCRLLGTWLADRPTDRADNFTYF